MFMFFGQDSLNNKLFNINILDQTDIWYDDKKLGYWVNFPSQNADKLLDRIEPDFTCQDLIIRNNKIINHLKLI